VARLDRESVNVTTVLTVGGAIVGSLATAVVALYVELRRARERDQARIDSLEKQLEEAITARLAVAEKNVEFALSLQKEHHTLVDKQMAIMQALQPRRGE
jgi:uncharacterized membrane protein (DUF106 family)